MELEEAREALRLVGVIVDAARNGMGASDGTMFSKLGGVRVALGQE